MDPSARMMQLLTLLQRRGHWTGDELAARLEVSLRTLRRDVERLRELGYPVDADRGVAGGYRLAPGAALPPLTVDNDEAVALVVALQSAAAADAPDGLADSAVSALAKVVQVLPPSLLRRVDALLTVARRPAVPGSRGEPIDVDVLVMVARACRDSERLTFGYRAGSGADSQRRVEPHHLVSMRNRWYTLAFDLDRQDWRIFRLDRLRDAKATGVRFRPREIPGGDPADYVRDAANRMSHPVRTIAVVEASAEEVEAAIGRWATITSLGVHRCEVRLETDDLGYPALALGSIGAEFTVREPPELIELVGEWGARFTRSANRK